MTEFTSDAIVIDTRQPSDVGAVMAPAMPTKGTKT